MITLNGKPEPLPQSRLLPDLLRGQGIDPESCRGVAVALNDEVVRKQRWADIRLHEGDRIEIVTALQGG